MTETLVILGIVVAAGALLAWRLARTFRGKGGCSCGSDGAANCPAAGRCGPSRDQGPS